MTKQEQNDIIKNVWTQHLQRTDDIPKDIANRYALWVQSKIKTAIERLKTAQAPEEPAA